MNTKLIFALLCLSTLIPSQGFAIARGEFVHFKSAIAKSAVGITNEDTGAKKGGDACTGTLVARDLVLTAAHCLIKTALLKPQKDVNVDLLAPKFQSNKSAFTFYLVSQGEPIATPGAADYRILPGFRIEHNTMIHDLALVKLDANAPDAYEAATLLEDQSKLSAGMALTIAGYGLDQTASDPMNSGQILRSIESVITEPLNADGNMLFKALPVNGLDIGDSGGPGYALIGASSYLAAVCSGRENLVSEYYWDTPRYIPVAPHIEWLKAAAKEMGSEL